MRRIAVLSLAILALPACEGGGESPPPPPPPDLRTAAPIPAGSTPPVTSFGQTVADASGLGEAFPAQANTWVVDRDYSLATGYGLQYDTALALYVGAPAAPLTHAGVLADLVAAALTPFPYDQDVSEAVFLTPLFSTADGVATVAVSDGVAIGVPALSGARSAYLNGTSDSRLERTLALAPGGTYTFGWTHAAILRAGALAGAASPPYGPAYRVLLRDPATGVAIGDPLFSSTVDVAPTTESVVRSGLPAQVVLSFELRSAAGGFAQVDDLAVTGGAGPVALANPGFEGGDLAGWTTRDAAESQNVRSGPRDVGPAGSALRITRTFYAPPSATWARLVDVFENAGTAPVTTKAVYLTALRGATPMAVVRQAGAAVVGWDADALGPSARDVGLVLGNGTALVEGGSPFVFVVHDVSLPAGGRTAVAHFVVQRGEAAGGLTAADVPAGTDADCAAIAAGFPGVEAYAIDLEPGVLDLVQNL